MINSSNSNSSENEEKLPGSNPGSGKSCVKILLLTNRDSDNGGDQVIEATDISLVRTAMANLGYSNADFKVISKAAAIVPKAYIETKDPAHLEGARKAIQKCDVVLFGGAPLFNYAYQTFYERTATTIELAAEYGKPVLFSAIGIEGYSETDQRCQRLKKALHETPVKQITTRDGIEKLEKYAEGSGIAIGKVADPAVFTAEIFRNHTADVKKKNKTIGIFVLRANGFKDNGVDFRREDAAKLWLDLIEELESRGYDYELLTSGHFGDEAFLDYMIRKHGVPSSKCVFNMNAPEILVKQIASYSGVISTRLHPNIISYSLQVPTVGIIWNNKVSRFYDSIGYSDRYLRVQGITAHEVVDRLEQAMAEGVVRNPEYMMTVYSSLMDGLRKCLCPNNTAAPYGFDELCKRLETFPGTSPEEQQRKLERKFRRTYDKYNELWIKRRVVNKKVEQKAPPRLRSFPKIVSDTIRMRLGKVPVFFYTLPKKGENVQFQSSEVKGKFFTYKSGAYEVKSTNIFAQEDNAFPSQCFVREGHALKGWKVRVKIGGLWHWHMADGSIALAGKASDEEFEGKKAIFTPGQPIPLSRIKDVSSMVAEAVWE